MAKQPPRDPQAKREAELYAQPIASRELILDQLREFGVPKDIGSLAESLAISSEDDMEALRRRLRAMCRDGQLMTDRRGRYVLVEKLDLLKGRLQGHRDGFGWLRPEDGSEDVYLHERQMHSAMDGDRVLVRVTGHRRDGKREGVVAEVVERANSTLTGQLQQLPALALLRPANTRIQQEILIRPEDMNGALDGSWVEVELTEYPERHRPAWGRVLAVLDHDNAQQTRIEVVLGAQGIRREWPQAVLDQIEDLPTEVPADASRKRVDLRELDLVTIDGEDARDFDDAVFCERKSSGGWRLLVAIADVSHYVEYGSALDEEARERGNSVYLPGAVVPMLPEALSNELCSLNPKVDRLCLVCEMSISDRGRLSRYQFYEGVIKSSARLTYTRVGRLLEEGVDAVAADDPEIVAVAPRLQALQELYLKLREARELRGAVDFSTTETRIVLDDNGDVSEIVPVRRNDAHKLVEECMIIANVAAARFIEKHKLPGLFRVHEEPDAARIEDLRGFLAGLGVQLPGREIPEPSDLRQLVESIQHRPDSHVIETAVLRSMNQAVYQPRNDGHFGLALPAYTHFTSPIRRYADLLVHRAIRHVIRSRQESSHVRRVQGVRPLAKDRIYPYGLSALENIGEHISVTERRAEAAGRDLEDWLKCEYMLQHLGSDFAGTVTGVTGFGIFIELDGLYVQGLIHVTMLPQDYYHYDDVNRQLVGETGGQAFGLGDRLQVQVSRVDVEERKIDFVLQSVLESGSARSRKGGDKGGDRGSRRGGRPKSRSPHGRRSRKA